MGPEKKKEEFPGQGNIRWEQVTKRRKLDRKLRRYRFVVLLVNGQNNRLHFLERIGNTFVKRCSGKQRLILAPGLVIS